MQAQGYLSASWAVGLPTRDATQSDVEQALAERAIVGTHFMRNTVHLVPACIGTDGRQCARPSDPPGCPA